MHLERVLEILRRDVLAAGGDEDVLLAVGDRQEAVVVEMADVARAKPPVRSQSLLRGLLVLVVTGEDRVGPDQYLAVVGDAQIDAGQRRPDGPEAESRRAVDRCRGRALRQSVALENQDVEGMEELDDLLRQRRAAGDADPQPSAQAVLDLRVHESVGELVLQCEPARQLASGLPQLARAPANAQRPRDQRPLDALLLRTSA